MLDLLKKIDTELFDEIIKIKGIEWTPSLNLFKGILWDELTRLAGFRQGDKTLSLDEREEIAKENYKKLKQDKSNIGNTYPKSFSWIDTTSYNYMTPVKNQGFCSSCAAFSSLAAVETMMKIKDPTIEPNLSEAQLFFKSPGFSKEDTPETHNCKTGMLMDKALDYLVDTGVVTESMYPYNLEDKFQDLPQGWENKTTKITGYQSITNPSEMKHWISTKGPLISAMSIYPDILFYGKGLYHPVIGNKVGGHGICVVGYNDDYEAWLCKNSWSSSWGENGYFWIKYGQCGVGARMWGIEGVIPPIK